MAGAMSVLLALALGLALRLWMLKEFFNLNGDPLIYGDLAKNLLLHGSYAQTEGGGVLVPALMRLPGYPLFLALCFRLFGMENYVSAAWVQIAMELAGCLLLADFARRIAPVPLSTGAAHCTLWLAALCPFTAIYAAEPLTEAPTLFAIALALWSAARFRTRAGVAGGAVVYVCGDLCGAAQAGGRAGGGGPGAGAADRTGAQSGRWRNFQQKTDSNSCGLRTAGAGTVCGLELAQLEDLSRFSAAGATGGRQSRRDSPPRLGALGEEWCLDFNSTAEVYWHIPGDTLEMNKLPARAFDSPEQYAETARLAAEYNIDKEMTPQLDASFNRLADERIAAHPLRYYLWLPLGRMADMWLRPRVENLPIDLDWWVYENHEEETCISWAYVGLNALYLLLGVAGMWLRPRFWMPMLAYMLMRSALLTTIAAPESRYTLECFPMLFALGGVAMWWGLRRIAALGKGIETER